MSVGEGRFRRRLARGLAGVAAYPALRALGECACGGRRRPRPHPRLPASTGCQTIGPALFKRPDPLIYDQYYLMALGLAVTWDNPDVRIEQGGVAVDAHLLKPGETYDVVARIWNGSTEAPAIALPVHFSYLSFGIGTAAHPIGTTRVDLGVKGSATAPAYARHTWTTPAAPGHYCLQIQLEWGDDANPGNNLGQHNTDVAPLNSPRARIEVPLRNPLAGAAELELRVDGYTLRPPAPCRDAPARVPEQAEDERSRRLRRALAANGYAGVGLPEGWTVEVDPPRATFEPGEERNVAVTAVAPDGFVGEQPLNLNAFAGDRLVGGVTFVVTGTA